MHMNDPQNGQKGSGGGFGGMFGFEFQASWVVDGFYSFCSWISVEQ